MPWAFFCCACSGNSKSTIWGACLAEHITRSKDLANWEESKHGGGAIMGQSTCALLEPPPHTRVESRSSPLRCGVTCRKTRFGCVPHGHAGTALCSRSAAMTTGDVIAQWHRRRPAGRGRHDRASTLH